MALLVDVELWTAEKLAVHLQEEHPHIADFIRKHAVDLADVDKRTKEVREWERWCRANSQKVKLAEADVPVGILPKGLDGILTDLRVGGAKKRFGPDDELYNKNPDLREKVARGNTILYLRDLDTNTVTYDNIIFALKKFTGGMGDEDENQPEDNKTWMKYFLKPLNQTDKIVCTTKANGEAAHFSARWIKDRFVLCAGSKNVHLLMRSEEDIALYHDSRFMVAKTVASSVIRLLRSLDSANLAILLNFLHHTQVTGVFEVLQPHYQHVVDLSYLSESQLNFITWTMPYGTDNNADSYCAMAPNVALDFAAFLGIKCIKYEIILGDEAEHRMNTVRRDHGYEGEVLYFMDKKCNVIGLVKKKTAWYVVLRAIREKASSFVAECKKNPSKALKENHQNKVSKRLDEIQKWLGFSDSNLNQWKGLGRGFIAWLSDYMNAKSKSDINVRGNFPILWNKYLADTEKSDMITWSS